MTVVPLIEIEGLKIVFHGDDGLRDALDPRER
jgi:hypothetical protein